MKTLLSAIGCGVLALLAFAGAAGEPAAASAAALALVAVPAAPLRARTTQSRLGPSLERRQDAWRVLPIEGAFELVYEDAFGARSIRRMLAQELKVGPGKTLLGGMDIERNAYRGFRADRIHLLIDTDTGAAVKRNILDWLLLRAERTLRAQRKAQGRTAA